jgi:hypothetical protein
MAASARRRTQSGRPRTAGTAASRSTRGDDHGRSGKRLTASSPGQIRGRLAQDLAIDTQLDVSFRSRRSSSSSDSLSPLGSAARARASRSAFKPVCNVEPVIPTLRATSTTERSEERTSSTAPRRNAGGYFAGRPTRAFLQGTPQNQVCTQAGQGQALAGIPFTIRATPTTSPILVKSTAIKFGNARRIRSQRRTRLSRNPRWLTIEALLGCGG